MTVSDMISRFHKPPAFSSIVATEITENLNRTNLVKLQYLQPLMNRLKSDRTRGAGSHTTWEQVNMSSLENTDPVQHWRSVGVNVRLFYTCCVHGSMPSPPPPPPSPTSLLEVGLCKIHTSIQNWICCSFHGVAQAHCNNVNKTWSPLAHLQARWCRWKRNTKHWTIGGLRMDKVLQGRPGMTRQRQCAKKSSIRCNERMNV